MEASADAADAVPIELAELDRGECLRLLAVTRFGRIAVRTHDGAPAIRPVNYAFDGPSQSIVFRTGAGSKLHALAAAGHAAFEIDGIDPGGRSAWSVIASGVTEEIVNPAEIGRLADLGVEPWAPTDKPFLIRLRAFTVSGRRITSAAR
ncbi:MAG: pyridoxamine 5'-phosphate oxidase family protein [Solirubrobacteraceae bacterium]